MIETNVTREWTIISRFWFSIAGYGRINYHSTGTCHRCSWYYWKVFRWICKQREVQASPDGVFHSLSIFEQSSQLVVVRFVQVHSIHEPKKTDPIKGFGELVEGDLENTEKLEKICQGVHTVLHLAGDPDPSATWDSLKKANIEGYITNIFSFD